MQIRLGYVANALGLFDASPSKTMTYKTWSSSDPTLREQKLAKIIETNIQNTLRALYYNIAHNVPLYRMSSSLIPLATHPDVDFDFIEPFRPLYEKVGAVVKEHGLRVSFHPNQFTLFTSPRDDVTEKAVEDMIYHYTILDAMGIADRAWINIHIGGSYGDKEGTLVRFFENVKQLPEHILARTTFENDDKTYNTEETLAVCEQLGQPMVFDYHHHMANLCEAPLDLLLPRIFATWDKSGIVPKVHLSSPKNEKEFRSHADYVDYAFVKPFITMTKALGQNFDVMIEAKTKDLAMFRLAEDLKKERGIE
ncbi:MAG: UV DNA damage repair endonuclease UvsE, partial [Bacilli bacterium]